MGIFSKFQSDVPDDTIGRILTRNPNVVKIEQVKERNVKYMPWLSSKKATVFHFQPEPIPDTTAIPTSTALLAPADAAIVGEKGTITTTQVTTLALEDGQGGQTQEVWFNSTQMTGTILAAITVAAAGGKKAYDLYRDFNKKE